MQQTLHTRTVLVPVFDGDITDEAFDVARGLLSDSDARLVLLHVGRSARAAGSADATEPESRWRRLASLAPGRTFVEAMMGDPARCVLAEAARFHSDYIVVPAPGRAVPSHAWEGRAVRRLVRDAPRQCVGGRTRATRAARTQPT